MGNGGLFAALSGEEVEKAAFWNFPWGSAFETHGGCMCVCSVAKLCLTLQPHGQGSLEGYSPEHRRATVHGIFQARTLEEAKTPNGSGSVSQRAGWW